MWEGPVNLFGGFSCCPRLHLGHSPYRSLRLCSLALKHIARMETSTRWLDETTADDPMDEFSRRLSDIVGGDALAEVDAQDDFAAGIQSEVCCVADSLSALSSPEEKLQRLMKEHAELLLRERGEQRLIRDLRDNVCVMRAKRTQLETLCKEVQDHYGALREEALRRIRQDEEKRTEMANRFQTSLTEIQEQIEHHSARNQKLCEDNAKLSDKLHSLLEQCQRREESLEKINSHRDLQQQLTSAKLDQANALLAEAQQKHQREKEYLLAEAVDKTRKCFAMKEEELSMKKKLALYSKKFDEFQSTLAKSNEIYARFKNEMENMSEKMKKLEKESNVWKQRFENCNKALTDLLEERSEKGKEYEVFVLTIHKLEKLCRALQDERKVLYAKIKDVRRANAETSPGTADVQEERRDVPDSEDDVATEEMRRLRAEQVKLQEFADSLTVSCATEREVDPEHLDEDLVAAAFRHFDKTLRPSPRIPEAEVEAEPEAEVEAEPKAQVEKETESKSEVKPTAEVKPEIHCKAETETKPGDSEEVKAEPDLEVEAEAEPVAKTKVEADSAEVNATPDELQRASGPESAPPPLGTHKKESRKNKKRKNGNRNL
ncbi:beta-taxilin-like isoform X1 [Corythoichthys intestinalis]|uniref:beta-taxilin-like isoform X1 n=1 Tax=Corythoichthys intestinalis TaxID=161448 RepID=UPI0025A635DA|nr:beta-taxilin-like isoform X1 [Corythoichthys intestinalis]